MDNQIHFMSIKQAKLIVNAHKHKLLNSFCNNRYVYVKHDIFFFFFCWLIFQYSILYAVELIVLN